MTRLIVTSAEEESIIYRKKRSIATFVYIPTTIVLHLLVQIRSLHILFFFRMTFIVSSWSDQSCIVLSQRQQEIILLVTFSKMQILFFKQFFPFLMMYMFICIRVCVCGRVCLVFLISAMFLCIIFHSVKFQTDPSMISLTEILHEWILCRQSPIVLVVNWCHISGHKFYFVCTKNLCVARKQNFIEETWRRQSWLIWWKI